MATRSDLDEMILGGCQNPDCSLSSKGAHLHKTLFLHTKCHPETPAFDISYTLGGTLEITCKVCGKDVLTVEVA